MKLKEKNEKAGLKLNSQKTKIMASNSIASWQIEGGKVKALTDFLVLGSKITVNVECSHEIKRCLLLGRKDMTNLDRILRKQKQTFIKRGQSSQNYGFSSTHVWI